MRSRWTAVCLVLCIAAFCGSAAAEQTIEVTRDGVTTPLVLPEYRSNEIPYASMADIARQLEARVTVENGRAVMELGGQQIEAVLEGTRVEAGGEILTLDHPVRGYHDDALVAMTDIVPILRAGFGFGTPDNPPTQSALQMDASRGQEELASDDALERTGLESIVLPEEDVSLESIDAEAVANRRPLDEPDFGGAGGFLLAVDPGHGGEDIGAVGPGGLAEKVVCLAVAQELRRVLKEEYGIASVTTREQDASRTLRERQGILVRQGVDLVVSIHGGTNYAPAARGPMVFAHKPPQRVSTDRRPGFTAARTLADALTGVAGDGTPPVYEVPLLLFRDYAGPAVLVELGNLMNGDEEAQLAEAGYQRTLAAALAEGINRLLERSAAEGGTP